MRGSRYEGAIGPFDGRVRLLREERCDSLSGCPLPSWNVSRPRAPPACNARGAGRARLAPLPCRLRFVPVQAPYFDGASPRIAADCAAFGYAGMHEQVLIGVPAQIVCAGFFLQKEAQSSCIDRENVIK